MQLDAALVLTALQRGALTRTPLLPVRSAEPATSPGKPAAVALRHWLKARRVASLVPGLEGGEGVGPAGDTAPGLGGLPRGAVAVPGGEALFPGAAVRRAADDLLGIELAHLVGHPERLVGRKAQDLLGHTDLVLAERVSVGVRAVGQLGRGPADVAAQHQEVRLGVGPVCRVIESLTDGRLERVDVVRHLAEVVHAPAVGLEALLDVVVVGQLGRPVDGDVVVVVEGDEPAQTEVAGQGAPPRARHPP